MSRKLLAAGREEDAEAMTKLQDVMRHASAAYMEKQQSRSTEHAQGNIEGRLGRSKLISTLKLKLKPAFKPEPNPNLKAPSPRPGT